MSYEDECYEFEYNEWMDEFCAYSVEYDTGGAKHRSLVATGERAHELRENYHRRHQYD